MTWLELSENGWREDGLFQFATLKEKEHDLHGHFMFSSSFFIDFPHLIKAINVCLSVSLILDACLFLYCWQIDVIEPQELTDERSRLRNLSSLTILAYIKTKFEDLMQLRLEEEKDSGSGKNKHGGGHGGRFDVNNGATSEFTSTFHSLDLPPEEYETQL